ncbi:uncharacterized protein BDR25DRAFT_356080 [Lindgomyces ingoldianus]|uniref:Uncharacterized protein n=1 Tax=Lindgomyces ingoldianus TaxID=673940 RepID=A0ACB6QS31_9PLEO|nr:uncharacterized protein BDR25DRAFT_356080 [Lindgomyces ingoldianus]KAF2469834.1 hypothetical protein BDR25DRAFT_356080 [Lindgomyces ingoldianus]
MQEKAKRQGENLSLQVSGIDDDDDNDDDDGSGNHLGQASSTAKRRILHQSCGRSPSNRALTPNPLSVSQYSGYDPKICYSDDSGDDGSEESGDHGRDLGGNKRPISAARRYRSRRHMRRRNCSNAALKFRLIQSSTLTASQFREFGQKLKGKTLPPATYKRQRTERNTLGSNQTSGQAPGNPLETTSTATSTKAEAVIAEAGSNEDGYNTLDASAASVLANPNDADHVKVLERDSIAIPQEDLRIKQGIKYETYERFEEWEETFKFFKENGNHPILINARNTATSEVIPQGRIRRRPGCCRLPALRRKDHRIVRRKCSKKPKRGFQKPEKNFIANINKWAMKAYDSGKARGVYSLRVINYDGLNKVNSGARTESQQDFCLKENEEEEAQEVAEEEVEETALGGSDLYND